MSVVVGGGTGFVGRNLCHKLKSVGYNVIVVSRSAGSNKITWNDLNVNGLPNDCKAVVNLAGENLMNPLRRWNTSFEKDLLDSRVNTTKALAEAISASKTPPEVFVNTSAVGFYAPDHEKCYTEESPGGNHDFLARLCSEWEAASKLKPAVRDSVRHVTIRVGIVLGRDGGVIQNIYPVFYLGLGGKIGSGNQWFPWIHISDIVGIYKHAITNPEVRGVLNGVAPQPVTNLEFTQTFARAINRLAFFPVPSFVMNLVYGSERAKAVLEGQKVVPEQTLKSGYKYEYPSLASACRNLCQ
ncbi:epimerase family protein SDR39U1-like [Argonauta hians]